MVFPEALVLGLGEEWRVEEEEEPLHRPARALKRGRLSDLEGEDWGFGAGDAELLRRCQRGFSEEVGIVVQEIDLRVSEWMVCLPEAEEGCRSQKRGRMHVSAS